MTHGKAALLGGVMLDLPICDVCNKPVDELFVEQNPLDSCQRITAACHGETETVSLDRALIVDAILGTIEFGRAFVREKRLEGR